MNTRQRHRTDIFKLNDRHTAIGVCSGSDGSGKKASSGPNSRAGYG
jgi:hypothetical protein